jgi:hypothetical protein
MEKRDFSRLASGETDWHLQSAVFAVDADDGQGVDAEDH